MQLAPEVLSGVLVSAPAPIGVVDWSRRWVWANTALLELLGCGSLDELQEAAAPAPLLAEFGGMSSVGETSRRRRRVELVRSKTVDDSLWVDVSVAAVSGVERLGVIVALHDVTERKLAADRRAAQLARERAARIAAERDAATDDLTGLLSRRQIDVRAAELSSLAARTGDPLSCLFVDIDRFKAVNDTYGHGAGDAVLQEVAERLREVARESDLVARRGGDEFVVLLPETGRDGALRLAHRIQTAIEQTQIVVEQPVDGDSVTISVTASVGVAEGSSLSGRRGAADLYAQADRALYDAKSRGGAAVAA